MAIQSSGENGNKNANNGISDLVFGDANNETPLWKYGILKSITCARALYKLFKSRRKEEEKKGEKNVKGNKINQMRTESYCSILYAC